MTNPKENNNIKPNLNIERGKANKKKIRRQPFKLKPTATIDYKQVT